MVKCLGICFSLCCALCSPPQRTRGGSNMAATIKREANSRETTRKSQPAVITFYYNFLCLFCTQDKELSQIHSCMCLRWTPLWRACHHLQCVSGTPPPVSPMGWGSTSWMVRETWGGGPLSALLCLREYMAFRTLMIPCSEHYKLIAPAKTSLTAIKISCFCGHMTEMISRVINMRLLLLHTTFWTQNLTFLFF